MTKADLKTALLDLLASDPEVRAALATAVTRERVRLEREAEQALERPR